MAVLSPTENRHPSVKRRVASDIILVVPSQHPSIAEIPESVLVERVMGSPRLRGHVLDCHGFPERPIWRLAVPMDGLPDRRGNVVKRTGFLGGLIP
jgi:hypothetical protein